MIESFLLFCTVSVFAVIIFWTMVNDRSVDGDGSLGILAMRKHADKPVMSEDQELDGQDPGPAAGDSTRGNT